MNRYELVIIGGGNMGAALGGGLLAAGDVRADRIAIVEVVENRRVALADLVPGVAVHVDVPPCDAAVIAVKPDAVPTATRAAVDAGAQRLLSIAAGVTIAELEAAAGGDVAVVRAMPNTPALVGRGAAAISGGRRAGESELAWAESILGAVGTVDRMGEQLLDLFTGLAGSGPAYVFLVAEALIDAAVGEGMPRPAAERIVTQLFVGSAALLERDGDPARLRANVTSPGGTTAAGIRALEAAGTRSAFADAVAAATRRSRELGG